MLISLPNAFGDAATNMAIDASLLATLPAGISVFRHYGWIEPAVTFGYTQKHNEVCKTVNNATLNLCRRITGGGIVDHRNDWTYALILQSEIKAAHTPANALYTVIHRAIQETLSKQHVQTQLAPCPNVCGKPTKRHSEAASQCFVTPAASDVLLPTGQKVAGAAMKRTKNGLLIQGSIDKDSLPDNFEYERFQSLLIEKLSSSLGITVGSIEDLRTLFNSDHIQEERQRFESETWLKKR